MQRRPMLYLVLTLALLAVSGAMSGCSKSDKGTNPMSTTEPFESGNLSSSGPTSIFVHRFNTVGSFGYRCRIHSVMTGTVDVAASGVDSPTVRISNNQFTPAVVSVKTGSYVKWANIGAPHTVTRL